MYQIHFSGTDEKIKAQDTEDMLRRLLPRFDDRVIVIVKIKRTVIYKGGIDMLIFKCFCAVEDGKELR
jgi:hypothetical protein